MDPGTGALERHVLHHSAGCCHIHGLSERIATTTLFVAASTAVPVPDGRGSELAQRHHALSGGHSLHSGRSTVAATAAAAAGVSPGLGFDDLRRLRLDGEPSGATARNTAI